METTRTDYPTPDELWHRYRAANGIKDQQVADRLLTPFNHEVGKGERYYAQIAVNRTMEAILKGQRQLLLTMATGTGKTAVAFQLCWKLWNSRWNRTGEYRRPRILYLADRNILVDQPVRDRALLCNGVGFRVPTCRLQQRHHELAAGVGF